MYNLLYNHLKSENPTYPEEEFHLLLKYLQVREHPKKTTLLREGNICQYGHYVVEGCFRYFTTNSDGIESITNFAFEDWWVGDIYSMLNHAPAKFSLEAIEDCKLLSLESKDFKYLLDHSPAFSKFKQSKRDKAYQAALTRSIDLRESAESKYEKFIREFPEAPQRIPQYYIASYLGITPESLSRLRKKGRRKDLLT